jgi:Rhodopirellula transposase DDE domain
VPSETALLVFLRIWMSAAGVRLRPRKARSAGYGGIAVVARATGIALSTVGRGLRELVGDFENVGQEWRPQDDPKQVRVHEFSIKERRRTVPYGIYGLAANTGWVSVCIDHDTAQLSARTIRNWWGNVGSRERFRKRELQKLTSELGINIKIHHVPSGASKWNKSSAGCFHSSA